MSKLKDIQSLCKNFRINILNLTLNEVCKNSTISVGTLSAFENGRSSNINHIFIYIEKCNEEQKEIFIKELNKIL